MPAAVWPAQYYWPLSQNWPGGVGAPVQNSWFRYNNNVFIPQLSQNVPPVAYNKHTAHCEVVINTTAAFTGSFTIFAVPSNTNVDASAIGIWVDNVFNQTVTFDVVSSNFGKVQAIVVNTGSPGVHSIRVQEGERDQGVFLTAILVAGSIAAVPAVVRQYTSYGDSVSMGAFAIPRSLGWALRMRGGASRFDGFALLGQSGLALSQIASTAPDRANLATFIVQSLIGSTENVLAFCLSINDWVTSANSTSAATFQTTLGATIDAIKAAADAATIPSFKVMLHSMTHIATAFQLPNDKGSTPADFNTAIQAVATARPAYTTYLDVFNACNDADMFDGFDHPNAVGHGKIFTVVQGAT